MFERMCYRDDIERFAINNGHRTSAESKVSRGFIFGFETRSAAFALSAHRVKYAGMILRWDIVA